MKLPEGIRAHKSISACAGCDRSDVSKVVGWMRFEIRQESITLIPGMSKPMTNFGAWTDYCTGCVESNKMTPASFDHPSNWGFGSDWDAYRAAGHGTEVPAIIEEMTSLWTTLYGSLPEPAPAPESLSRSDIFKAFGL